MFSTSSSLPAVFLRYLALCRHMNHIDHEQISLEERRKVAEGLIINYQEVIRNCEGRANSQSNTSNSKSADYQNFFSEIATRTHFYIK